MSAIKVGDLVMVVRSCCGVLLGVPFTVARCDTLPGFHCRMCGFHIEALTALAGTYAWCAPQSWLIKIDPPAQPESVTRDAEVTA